MDIFGTYLSPNFIKNILQNAPNCVVHALSKPVPIIGFV